METAKIDIIDGDEDYIQAWENLEPFHVSKFGQVYLQEIVDGLGLMVRHSDELVTNLAEAECEDPEYHARFLEAVVLEIYDNSGEIVARYALNEKGHDYLETRYELDWMWFLVGGRWLLISHFSRGDEDEPTIQERLAEAVAPQAFWAMKWASKNLSDYNEVWDEAWLREELPAVIKEKESELRQLKRALENLNSIEINQDGPRRR